MKNLIALLLLLLLTYPVYSRDLRHRATAFALVASSTSDTSGDSDDENSDNESENDSDNDSDDESTSDSSDDDEQSEDDSNNDEDSDDDDGGSNGSSMNHDSDDENDGESGESDNDDSDDDDSQNGSTPNSQAIRATLRATTINQSRSGSLDRVAAALNAGLSPAEMAVALVASGDAVTPAASALTTDKGSSDSIAQPATASVSISSSESATASAAVPEPTAFVALCHALACLAVARFRWR